MSTFPLMTKSMNETSLDLFVEKWWEDAEILAAELELTLDYVIDEFVINGELHNASNL
jgi:hypothetical protein